ncbi:josephin-like protein isoform X2 [Lycorma delicatula]|uniref:josephin-like protein isoform X2 n=1 Tax=Lycorma delicatula TaxID=130591 RepID=UPI003F5107D2
MNGVQSTTDIYHEKQMKFYLQFMLHICERFLRDFFLMVIGQSGNTLCFSNVPRDPESLELNRVFGFILNVPSDFRFRFVVVSLRRRHWIAIRRVNGAYYNLDSKLDSPFLIGQDGELVQYLREQIQNKEKELFIVVSKQTEESRLWLNNNCSVVGNNYSVDSVSDR